MVGPPPQGVREAEQQGQGDDENLDDGERADRPGKPLLRRLSKPKGRGS
jgi:hypothetical protein